MSQNRLTEGTGGPLALRATHVDHLDRVQVLQSHAGPLQVPRGHRQVQVHVALTLLAHFGKQGSIRLEGVEGRDCIVIGI